jgi:hypothetical protein
MENHEEAPRQLKFERGPIATYVATLKETLLHPRRFFRNVPLAPSAGLAGPLAFGLVSHWLGRAVEQLWNLGLNLQSSNWADNWLGGFNQVEVLGRAARWHEARARFQEWLHSVGSVVADPFIAVLMILAGALFLYLSARIFIGSGSDSSEIAAIDRPTRKITFDSSLRIVAYSQAAALLAIVPGWGGTLAWIGTLALTWFGTREIYNVSGGRAAITVLFSKITVAFIMAAVALAIIMLIAFMLLVHVIW